MGRHRKTVMGIHAPSPRRTLAGGLWLALVVTLPLGALLAVVEAAMWLFG